MLSPELVEFARLAPVGLVVGAYGTLVGAGGGSLLVPVLLILLRIVPIFALANAGIPLSADAITDAASSRIAWGVAIGLVVGKLVGIWSFAWLAVRLHIGTLAPELRGLGLAGVAALGGIGFTVSIFVSGLAFESIALQDEAKIGILTASVTAGALGAGLLSLNAARTRARP